MRKILILLVLVGCGDVEVATVRQPLCGELQDCCGSPIIIDVAGDRIRLTDSAHGVSFSLKPGEYKRYAWTEAGSDDAWLALDHNGDGKIRDGSELFGNFTPQDAPAPGEFNNGFAALALLDANEDGQVNAEDPSFAALRLWQDRNHDGISQADELMSLDRAGITGLSVVYSATDRKDPSTVDEHRNWFAYEASVYVAEGSTTGVRAWDVYLGAEDDPLVAAARRAGGGAEKLVLGILAPIGAATEGVWYCTSECAMKRATGSTVSCPSIVRDPIPSGPYVGTWGVPFSLPPKVAACADAEIRSRALAALYGGCVIATAFPPFTMSNGDVVVNSCVCSDDHTATGSTFDNYLESNTTGHGGCVFVPNPPNPICS